MKGNTKYLGHPGNFTSSCWLVEPVPLLLFLLSSFISLSDLLFGMFACYCSYSENIHHTILMQHQTVNP